MPRSPRWARKFFDDVVMTYDGDECLTWPYATIKGYGAMRVDGETVYVCRLAVKEPQPSPDHLVAHSCGRGQFGCVARNHLIWKTQKGNKADELLHGTRNFGERNGGATLTEPEVLETVELLKGPLTRADIGALYGVSREAVNEIAWGKNWGWLTGLKPKEKANAKTISSHQ